MDKENFRNNLIDQVFGNSEKPVTEDYKGSFSVGTRNVNHKKIRDGVFSILEECGISKENKVVIDIVANFMANIERTIK